MSGKCGCAESREKLEALFEWLDAEVCSGGAVVVERGDANWVKATLEYGGMAELRGVGETVEQALVCLQMVPKGSLVAYFQPPKHPLERVMRELVARWGELVVTECVDNRLVYIPKGWKGDE